MKKLFRFFFSLILFIPRTMWRLRKWIMFAGGAAAAIKKWTKQDSNKGWSGGGSS